MKLVFTHDHIFKQDTQGNYYTGGAFNNTVWKRYLKHFKHVTVLARLAQGKTDSHNEYNKFNLSEVSFLPVPSLSGPINQYINSKKAYQIIKENLVKSDALIVRLPSEIGNMSIKIAKKLNKPYIIEVAGCVWDSLWNYGSILAKLYAPIAMYKMKNYIKKAPYVIYVTNEFLQKRYPSSGLTENISNVEIHNVDYKSLENRLKRYNNNDKTFKIGMIGSLNNNIKGWDVAFKALGLLKKENINFKFKILGDGDPSNWKPLINELGITESVEFCGVLPGGDPVLKWIDSLDLYIQPSYQEGLPRAIIEAMSRGCPVVGSSAGGIPELINRDFIHEKGDFLTLSKLLKLLLIDPRNLTLLAKENIKESYEYLNSRLDKKRDDFITTNLINK